MAYRVLSRRYRPKVFEDLLGQPHVTRTLSNAIAEERTGHAYLFTGPRGVGKTTAARLFAKALNCAKGPTATPCNNCSSCLEIDESRSMDVYEIDGASNTGVDNIREIKSNVQYPPSRDRYKIYIIDEVHMLSQGAFNALLKTLEEPPEHVIFIFATTEPHKVPLTIQSRCQRFDFRKLRNSMVMQSLAAIAGKEGITIDDESKEVITRYAQGSLRDAQSLLEQAISYSGKTIKHEEIYKSLGILERDVIVKAVSAMAHHDVAEAALAAREVDARGYDPKRFIEELLSSLRDIYLLAMSLDELVELPDAEVLALKKISSSFTQDDLLHLMNAVSKGVELIIRSTQPAIALEIVLIKAASLKPLLPIDQILSDLKKFKSSIDQTAGSFMHEKPVGSPVPGKGMSDDGTSAVAKAADSGWSGAGRKGTPDGFIEHVYQKNGPLAAELGEANISIEKNGEVNIFIKEHSKNSVTDLEKNRELIRQFVKEYFGMQYDVVLHKDAPPESNKEIIKDDQKLNKLLDVFGAKIIKKM
ncbi:MAG: DNA polymerase III subunit gamma/tau [Deltaproteobacteria bacterium]|nr:DNA polymerase III subunit gamma/tau [Deltaproteobacteria bacterium]